MPEAACRVCGNTSALRFVAGDFECSGGTVACAEYLAELEEEAAELFALEDLER